MPLTWNAFLLGTGPDNDTDEEDLATESDFAGASVGSASDPLSDQVHEFTINDADGDGIWDRDNDGQQTETSTVTKDGVTENVQLDSVIVYNATITFDDGTTANITAVTFQLTDGRVFLAPEFEANADDAAMTSKPIESITLNSVASNSTNLVADRQVGNFVICFAGGSHILTPEGARPVETLRVGDLVVTADRGAQPIRWIGAQTREAVGDAAPVEIAPGFYGATRPLLLSQQHRVLFDDRRASLLFGSRQVLAPAKALLNERGVRLRPGGTITYHHLLLDRHEVIYADGVGTESFQPGETGLSTLSDEERAVLTALSPDIATDLHPAVAPARPCLRPWEARVLSREVAA